MEVAQDENRPTNFQQQAVALKNENVAATVALCSISWSGHNHYRGVRENGPNVQSILDVNLPIIVPEIWWICLPYSWPYGFY